MSGPVTELDKPQDWRGDICAGACLWINAHDGLSLCLSCFTWFQEHVNRSVRANVNRSAAFMGSFASN